MRVLFLNGPNLNMLGEREESLYGQLTLNEINDLIQKKADNMGIQVDFFQSNEEGKLVSRIQESSGKVDFIVINPAAFTHTSHAIRLAVLGVQSKSVDGHISIIFIRESFRQNSYVSSISLGVISGFGHEGYLMALDALSSLNK